ncbi:MAG: HTTM domain-containing protein [Planctomycetota bacterium]
MSSKKRRKRSSVNPDSQSVEDYVAGQLNGSDAGFIAQMGNWMRHIRNAWNGFWFRKSMPHTLGLMRILVGSMLVYTHVVWTLGLSAFLSPGGMIPDSYRYLVFDRSSSAWSLLDWFSTPGALMTVHWVCVAVLVMFMLGLFTRVTAVFSWLIVVSYANRATGALFGLDQINAFLVMYLMIGNCGGAYSLDNWLRKRKGRAGESPLMTSDVLTNVATRLIQVHLCIVYLFAGTGKLQGSTWWNGEAIWGALASYEYQTMDMTWLADYMWIVNLITLVSITWELFYPFLIWHRLTRPVFIALAVMIHLGIGASMGMMTFGLIMVYANMAFIEPATTKRCLSYLRIAQ